MKLTEFKISDDTFKYIAIKELTDDGVIHRRSLTPDMTISDDEYPEIKALAEKEWTAKIKTAYAKHRSDTSKLFNQS
tara:strand:- start:4416 stop:4646 length:231 start_codon:yes stop_codon:yes gene_type:complete